MLYLTSSDNTAEIIVSSLYVSGGHYSMFISQQYLDVCKPISLAIHPDCVHLIYNTIISKAGIYIS